VLRPVAARLGRLVVGDANLLVGSGGSCGSKPSTTYFTSAPRVIHYILCRCSPRHASVSNTH